MTLGNVGSTQPAQHRDRIVHGEYANDVFSPGDSLDAMYYPAPACGTGGVYECGAVQSITYWELAWNRCKLAFYGCGPSGTSIVQAGSYSNTPWLLANAAFAWAMSRTTGASTVDSFLSDVYDRYNQNFLVNGYLDSASFLRVSSVLAHHCVGRDARCGASYFKLPGSKLPAADTYKKLFDEAETATYSGQTVVSAVNAASGDAYLSVTGPTCITSLFNLGPTDGGAYRVEFSGRRNNVAMTQVAYQVDGGSFYIFPTLAATDWAWTTSNESFVFSGSTSHTICVEQGNGVSFDLDVIVLTKQ